MLHRILIKFIVGSQPCPIPALDRLDQYSCEPDVVVDPGISILSYFSSLILLSVQYIISMFNLNFESLKLITSRLEGKYNFFRDC